MQVTFREDLERAQQDGTEWRVGAVAKDLALIPLSERFTYLPKGVIQRNNVMDTSGCASRTPIAICKSKFTYFYHNGMLPENKLWLEQNGYIKDGKVVFDETFIEILSGTTRNGNSLKAPLEAIRKYGLIPELLPLEDNMSWEQYMDKNRITKEMYALGEEFLRRFTINYEQVPVSQFLKELELDFLDVAGYAWPTPVNGVYMNVPGASFNHAFAPFTPVIDAFDSYPEYNPKTGMLEGDDFIKRLSPDYSFFEWGYTISITSQQIPDPLSTLPSWQSVPLFDWLVKMIIRALSGNKDPMPPLPQEILPDPKPIPPNNLLNTFCLAIQKHEGWFPGSRSQRNNNPGNCKYSSVGYLPIYGKVGKDAQNFAIFKDYETGFLYLKNLVKSKIAAKPNQDSYTFFSSYAPDSDGNNSRHYAETVAAACDIVPTAPLKILL